MPNPRIAKLAEQIRLVVAQMLERRVKDPRLGFVTITEVRLTGDAHDATVFYTSMGTDAERAETAIALESAKGMIRSQVGKQLGMKFTPTLTFVLDAVPESAAQIEDLLAAVRSDDAEIAAQAATATYAGDADPYKAPRDEDDD